jgi:hypothetical protein
MDEWKYIAMFMFLKYLSRAASRNCLQTCTSSIIGHFCQKVLCLNLGPEDILSFSSLPPIKQWDIALKQAITASFHILSSSSFTYPAVHWYTIQVTSIIK